MKTITNGKRPFLAVPVKKYDTFIDIVKNKIYIDNENGERVYISVDSKLCLEYLGKLSELTEEQAAELVEIVHYDFNLRAYKDYYSNSHSYGEFISAIGSLHSLLQSNDCWLKEWIEAGREKIYDSHDTSPESMYYHQHLHKRMNQAAEDFLIILID